MLLFFGCSVTRFEFAFVIVCSGHLIFSLRFCCCSVTRVEFAFVLSLQWGYLLLWPMDFLRSMRETSRPPLGAHRKAWRFPRTPPSRCPPDSWQGRCIWHCRWNHPGCTGRCILPVTCARRASCLDVHTCPTCRWRNRHPPRWIGVSSDTPHLEVEPLVISVEALDDAEDNSNDWHDWEEC